MPNVKCDNCNHFMIPRKDYYECPICHSKKDNVVDSNECNKNYKEELTDYIAKGKNNDTILLTLAKNVLSNNIHDQMAILMSSFLERETKPDLYKKEINEFFSNSEERDNFEITFKYLAGNSEYKFLTYLEEILSRLDLSDECKEFLDEKKEEIEEFIEKTSVIKSDVFVCYSSNDLDRTKIVVGSIEDAGFSCWYADRNMPKNHPTVFDYKKNIENAIENCKVFLVLSSKNCMYSSDVQWELDIARTASCKRVEYLISSVKHTPKFRDFFDGIQWIDATESDETDVLVERINYLINNTEEEFNDVESFVEETHVDVEPFVEETNDSNDTFIEDVFDNFSNDTQDESYDNQDDNINNLDEVDLKELGIAAFENNDYEDAISKFNSCEPDSEIYYYLGSIFMNQDSDKFDVNKAYEYFMKTDDSRIYDEINELGKMFFIGNVCPNDYDKAFNCFDKASNLGNEKAMANLALCYIKGRGVEKDIDMASKYYKKAADLGNVRAMYEYGVICIDNNSSEGIDYITKAAESGLTDAQYVLGVCYYRGQVIPFDFDKSVEWLDKAISGGSRAAQDYKSSHISDNDADYYNSNSELKLDTQDDNY